MEIFHKHTRSYFVIIKILSRLAKLVTICNHKPMKTFQKFTVVCTLFVFFGAKTLATAQPVTESEATPSASALEKIKVLITEVSFKNSDADYVSFILSAAPHSPFNLKGLTFQDDSDFKTLNTDFYVYPGQTVTLLFKQTTADTVPTIATTRTGLTATTEQIIIKDDQNKILDAVCWANTKPTVSELSDMNDLYEQNAWNSNTAGSCIPSDEVETNGFIKRKSITDTNSLSDWDIVNEQTAEEPAEQTTASTSINTALQDTNPSNTSTSNVTLAEDSSTDEEASETFSDHSSITVTSLPESSTTTTKNKPVAKKTTKKTTAKKTKKSSAKSKKVYQNGDLSSDIHINEFMPNPLASDQKNEWIEIINTGDVAVNLGNWQLDDDEGGSKPYVIPDSVNLEPQTPLLIPITDSKISLANKEDAVRVLNFDDEVIDEVSYQDAGDDMAYARISIEQNTNDSPTSTQEIENDIPIAKAATIDEDTWMWVKTGTPGEPNPSMQKIHGTILEEPQFTPPYSLKVKSGDDEITVYFDENVIKAPLAQSLFTKNASIDLLLEPDENGDLWIQKYEILESQESPTDFNIIPWLIIGFIVAAGGTFLFLQKRLPWQKKEVKPIQVQPSRV